MKNVNWKTLDDDDGYLDFSKAEMDEAMQQSCFFSHVTVTLVLLNKNETGCCSSIVRPFDSGIRGALV